MHPYITALGFVASEGSPTPPIGRRFWRAPLSRYDAVKPPLRAAAHQSREAANQWFQQLYA